MSRSHQIRFTSESLSGSREEVYQSGARARKRDRHELIKSGQHCLPWAPLKIFMLGGYSKVPFIPPPTAAQPQDRTN